MLCAPPRDATVLAGLSSCFFFAISRWSFPKEQLVFTKRALSIAVMGRGLRRAILMLRASRTSVILRLIVEPRCVRVSA